MWRQSCHVDGLPGGVIGNTRDFGSLIPGSSPGRVVFLELQRFLAAVGGERGEQSTYAI